MAFTKLTFCVKENQERPYRRATKGRGWVCLFCGDPVQLRNKYRNEPVVSKHTGRLIQSKKEARREPVLLALQNAGLITELRYQVPYRLELYATGAVDELLDAIEMRSSVMPGELIRLAGAVRRSRQMVAKWVSDYDYMNERGEHVVEDVKSRATATPAYKLKRRLMVLAHNLEIVEPEEGGVQQRARGAGIHGRGTGSRFVGGR